MKALIDTCVIIDVLQNRKPFCNEAQKLFIAAANKAFDGFLTAKSVTDIYYIVHKATHNDKETRLILEKLFILFGILDTVGTDCRCALSSDITDYEDAVMIETAIRSGIDCIITRNQKDYRKSSVIVYTPAEFISIITAE